jgi:hypothetical protein
MANDKLNKLKQAAQEYLNRERKILNAQYSYLDKILKARGFSKIEEHNNEKASELLINNLKDFLKS